jgi:hypothetical protein
MSGESPAVSALLPPAGSQRIPSIPSIHPTGSTAGLPPCVRLQATSPDGEEIVAAVRSIASATSDGRAGFKVARMPTLQLSMEFTAEIQPLEARPHTHAHTHIRTHAHAHIRTHPRSSTRAGTPTHTRDRWGRVEAAAACRSSGRNVAAGLRRGSTCALRACVRA